MTAECFDLKYKIERLIRDERLQQYKVDRQGSNRNDQQGDCRGNDVNQRNNVGVIQTIFGGPYIGREIRRSIKNYAYEAKEKYNGSFFSISSRGAKTSCCDGPSITFTEKDANGVHFPQNDTLIVEAMIDNYTACRVLIDDGSSVDILYSNCLEKMGIAKS